MNLRAVEKYINLRASAGILLIGGGVLGAAFLHAGCDRNPSLTPVTQATSAPIPEFTPYIRFLREADPTSGEASYPYPPGFFLRHPLPTPNNYIDSTSDFRLQVITAVASTNDGTWVSFQVDIGRKSKNTMEGGWEGAVRDVDLTRPHTLHMRWRNFTFTDNYLDSTRIGPDPTTLPQV